MNKLLAVDKDIEMNEKHAAEWAKYGIGCERVNTMNEAISMLARSGSFHDFLFISINEDTTPKCVYQLPVIRDITNLPIFVITSSHTLEKKIEILNAGADVYETFSSQPRENVLAALELLKQRNRWSRRPSKPVNVLSGGDVVMSQSCHVVYVQDTELPLSKKEYDILECLMLNIRHIVTHEELLKRVWGKDYGEEDAGVLWRTVNRLRKKISDISPDKDYIKVDRKVGYRFSP